MAADRPVQTTSPEVAVVCVEDRHLPMLTDFYRAVWDPRAELGRVQEERYRHAQQNPAAGGREPPTFLCLRGGQAIGHVGTIPTDLWLNEAKHPAHWIKGLWVLPEHRNGPVGYLVLKEAVSQVGPALAVVGDDVPLKLFRALGFSDLGTPTNFVRVLRPATLLRGLDADALGLKNLPLHMRLVAYTAKLRPVAWTLAGLAHAAARACTLAVGGRNLPFAVRPVGDVPATAVDALSLRLHHGIAAMPARDSGYLKWRYGQARDRNRYVAITIIQHDTLLGLAILRSPKDRGDGRLRGIRVSTLSELLFDSHAGDVGLALIAAAERTARERFDAHALLCTASHKTAQRALRRRAFLSLPGNTHILFRGPTIASTVPSLDNWWITRGDSYADDMF